MDSDESISAAIQSIPSKKDALRRALDLLHGRIATAPAWADVGPHFDALHSSLESRFRRLHSSSPAAAAAAAPIPKSEKPVPKHAPAENGSATTVKKEGDASTAVKVAALPELKDLCEKMDAEGLRKYIVGKKDDVPEAEVVAALRCAPDPAKLVLDAVEVFFGSSRASKDEAVGIRKVCIFLLEKLAALPPDVRAKGRDRGLALAELSLEKTDKYPHNFGESNAFLLLVLTFDLFSAFGSDVLCDYVVDKVSWKRKIVDICSKLFPVELASDLVDKLSSKGYQLDALYFAYAFGVEDKFSVATLLNAYLDEAKKQSEKTLNRDGNAIMNKNDAIAKEASAIRAVIRFVDDHNLASKLPSTLSSDYLGKKILELESQKSGKKILELESQKSGKKRPATINHAPRKRRTSAASSSVAGVLQAAPHMNLLRQQQQQPVGGLFDHVPAYLPHAGGWRPPLASFGNLGGPSSLGINRTDSHFYPSQQYLRSVAGLNERAVNFLGGLYPAS